MASSEEPSYAAMIGCAIAGAVIWYFSKWWIGLITLVIVGGGMSVLETEKGKEINTLICGAIGGIAAWYFFTWWAGLIVFILLFGILFTISGSSNSTSSTKLPPNGRFNPRTGEWE